MSGSFSYSNYIMRGCPDCFWQEVVVHILDFFFSVMALDKTTHVFEGVTQTLIFFFYLLLPFSDDLVLPLSLILFSHRIDKLVTLYYL